MILKRQEKDNLIKALYDSSNVLASTYDNTTSDLTIIFKGGNRYKYSGVSKTDYMRFEIAESQGAVFSSHIKKYAFEKLTPIDPSKILFEAEKLANEEEEALFESQKTSILEALQTSLNIGLRLTSQDDPSSKENFIKSLKEVKDVVTNFLTQLKQD